MNPVATEEAEANLFAMCLLMPEDLLRDELDKWKSFDLISDKDTITLAKKFQVSVPMMAFRLGMLFGNTVGRQR